MDISVCFFRTVEENTCMLLRIITCLFLFVTSGRMLALPTDEASLEAEVTNPQKHLQAAITELQRIAPQFLANAEKERDGPAFLAFLKSENVAPILLSSGSVATPFDQTLTALRNIWRADAKGLDDPRELSTAIAVALTFFDASWPADNALARYAYYRDSRIKGLLHPMFDKLNAWEKRYVVRGGGNGSYNNSGGWDDNALAWLRDNVKLPMKDYTDACWQAPYRLNNVYGDSIHGSNYYLPFTHVNGAKRVRDVGGVCGSLSHYGAMAAMANGIPALTMGEPGHCAYAVRTASDEWTPAYTLSWERGLHCSLWPQRTWTSLVLQNKVLAERYAHEKSCSFVWLARALQTSNPALAESAYRLALESQPLNQPAWLEAVAFRQSLKPDLASWQAMHKTAITALTDFPEAAWEVLGQIEKSAIPLLPEDQKINFLLDYHRAVAKKDGPVMWHFEKSLGDQLALLPTDPPIQLAYFEAVLTELSASKSWFAPTIAWGQNQFTKTSTSADSYYAALGRAFSSPSAAGNPDGLRSALRPAILAAEKSNNVSAFQTLGKAGISFLTKEPLKLEAFPGDLLSSGGIINPSSTSGWDSPETHWGVLEATGGSFHTEKQVHAGCIARLGKLGDLSGIIIVNSGGGQNGPRQIPLQVSISEDGKTWTKVFEATENAEFWRIPLQGKAQRVQFIKCERSDERSDFFHLKAILAYGKRLQ
jgi:hypothetical protein